MHLSSGRQTLTNSRPAARVIDFAWSGQSTAFVRCRGHHATTAVIPTSKISSQHYPVTPSSHGRHGQDKTVVLSCLCRWCELNWQQVKTVFSSPQYIWDWTVMSNPVISWQDKTVKKRNMFSLEIFCLWQFSLVSRSHHQHRKDKTVLSCPYRRCELGGKNSGKVLPQYFAYARVSSLHESNFACYNCINGITSTADEYNFTSYNCIINITICGRTVEEDYPSVRTR